MGISLTVSCIIFLSIILVPKSPFDLIRGVVKLGIVMTFSCFLDILGIFNGFSTICTMCLLICVFIWCLNPALPCPSLGFVCETSFSFETIGLIFCFSGCACGSKLLPTPRTSGKFIPLEISFEPYTFLNFLYYNICHAVHYAF